jgi:hypothetical protein
MRERMRPAVLLALCALLVAACSPGQAVSVLRQDAQNQNGQPEPEPIPTPRAGQGADASEQGIIQVLIARANFEQEQAIASRDTSVMRDTATDRYFRQMTQTNQDLLESNVVSIKLIAMEWGTVTIRGTAALATTYETWSTTFADGRTAESRDRNDYRLIKQNGVWKIDSDVHPGNSPLPPGSRQV